MKRAILCFCLILLSCLTTYATRIAINNAWNQWKNSQVVLKGTVLAVKETDGPTEAYRHLRDYWEVRQASVRVQDVFKGDLAGREINVFFVYDPKKEAYYIQLQPTRSYVFFLNKNAGGFSFGDSQNGAYLVVAEAPKEQVKQGLDRLRQTFEDSLESQDLLVVLYALESLFYIGNEKSLQKVRDVLDSSNECFRSAAKAILIKHGEWWLVKDVVRFLRSGADKGCGFDLLDYDKLQLMMSESLTMIRNPSAERVIVDLIKEGKGYSDGLLESLEHIGTADSTDILLDLVRDPDKDLSFRAHRALAKICGVSYSSVGKFQRDKEEIIQTLEKAVKEKKAEYLREQGTSTNLSADELGDSTDSRDSGSPLI